VKPDRRLIDQLEQALRLAGVHPGDRALLTEANRLFVLAAGGEHATPAGYAKVLNQLAKRFDQPLHFEPPRLH